jgi:hypothetical protein
LRSTFDGAADLYDRARPRCPEALFHAVVHHCGLHPGDRVLEIGSGTGIATRPMVDRGLMVMCVELGGAHAGFENLAAGRRDPVRRRNRGDGVALDRPSAAPKLAALLRRAATSPNGRRAMSFPPAATTSSSSYRRCTTSEALPDDATRPSPAELAPPGVEAASNGLFVTAATERVDWELSYDAASYTDLLDTFSGQTRCSPGNATSSPARPTVDSRGAPAGRLRRHWGAVLEISRPVEPQPRSR